MAPSTVPTTVPIVFAAVVNEIDGDLAARMSASWRPGCSVELEDLRHLEITHWDFGGRVSTGELVVHADHADAVVEVMRMLFEAGFPIERMELVDAYGGDDDRSMAANNTSAFNCREVAWRPGVWSNHALGLAIDINPLVNPYVADGVVLPPGGADYVDRTTPVTGGIYPGDTVVEAFASIGWGWGGDWPVAKDWQHFSATGR